MRDRYTLALLHLEDGLVVVDEETALDNVAFEGRQGSRSTFRNTHSARLCRIHACGKLAYRAIELDGEVTMGDHAVARRAAIEAILAGPGAQHHLGMSQEVPVEGDVHAFDGQCLCLKPGGIGMIGR